MALPFSVRRSLYIAGPERGRLRIGSLSFPCLLGRTGITHKKREGDGGTPAGLLTIQSVFFRPDRVKRPQTRWPTYALSPSDGWCDDPEDPNYNRRITRPYKGRHEELWREDHVYDVILNTSWNYSPRIRGAGSAIFIHLSSPDGRSTAGCIAVSWLVMRTLLTYAPYQLTVS